MKDPGDETSDTAFDEHAKRVFDDSVEALDAAALSRLNRGRQAALAELDQAARRPRWAVWTPAAGAAAAIFVAVMMIRAPGATDPFEAPASDIEILLGEESIEMLEDLEFYSWLESTDLASEGEVG